MNRLFLLMAMMISLLAQTVCAMDEFVLTAGEEPGDTAVMFFYPADEPCGLAVVGCPGGGYAAHAMGREGHDFAPWLNSLGIDYAVVRYRLPRQRHDVPSLDVRKAIRMVRGLSTASKVGVMGFSAGGHLASTVALQTADSVSQPDFQILFYPVITMDESFTHEGTRLNLIGECPPSELEDMYSGEKQVSASTPPALIFHCTDDKVVPVRNALEYYHALLQAGVDVEMHIFPEGGHGWGFRDSFPYKLQWAEAMKMWLDRMKGKGHERGEN